jgi:hypothetical protein
LQKFFYPDVSQQIRFHHIPRKVERGKIVVHEFIFQQIVTESENFLFIIKRTDYNAMYVQWQEKTKKPTALRCSSFLTPDEKNLLTSHVSEYIQD